MGTYLAAGPGWDGQAGDEFDGVLSFETDLVFMLGRTQLLGADDVPTLSKVMDEYQVQTLSSLSRPKQSGPPTCAMAGMER